MTASGGVLVRRTAVYGLALAALVGVFLLYLRPEFMVTLAQQVWGCF